MRWTRRAFLASSAVAVTSLSSTALFGTLVEAPPAIEPSDARAAAQARSLIDRGLDYLKQHQQPDGSWQQPGDFPAITAIAIKAFVQDPQYSGDEPFLKTAFAKLLSYQKDDGSISNDLMATYNTAIAISALARSKQAQYEAPMRRALAYLRQLQWCDKIQDVPANLKVTETNPNYGGFGYDKKGKRADLSNVQIALDALHDAGLKPDDPAFQAALKFVSRTQNNSETNPEKWASDDGGFIYTCADGGNSKAGEYLSADGRKMFRSYGSMSYAGLKSMIYAGLSPEDPRVKAAWKWVSNNWTLDENPGIRYGDPANPKGGDDGLFYYYHTLARGLHAYGQPLIKDSKGIDHDWRVELIAKLTAQQTPDGHWVGLQKWMENKPILSSAYAILSLQEALADIKEHSAR